ncbi:hypothetical protein B7463_g5079, partial [Scytalidium lignicola]
MVESLSEETRARGQVGSSLFIPSSYSNTVISTGIPPTAQKIYIRTENTTKASATELRCILLPQPVVTTPAINCAFGRMALVDKEALVLTRQSIHVASGGLAQATKFGRLLRLRSKVSSCNKARHLWARLEPLPGTSGSSPNPSREPGFDHEDARGLELLELLPLSGSYLAGSRGKVKPEEKNRFEPLGSSTRGHTSTEKRCDGMSAGLSVVPAVVERRMLSGRSLLWNKQLLCDYCCGTNGADQQVDAVRRAIPASLTDAVLSPESYLPRPVVSTHTYVLLHLDMATTFTLTETLTTTDATNRIHTVTTTIVTATTPQPPTVTPTSQTATATVSQMAITPPPIVKTKATGSTSSSSGLSKGTTGGIIAAAGVVLIVIVVATFFILRRLNKVMKSNRNSKTSGGPRSGQHHDRPSYNSEFDNMSFDPLMIMGSESAANVPRPAQPTMAYDPSQPAINSVSPPLPTSFSPESIGVPFSPNDYMRGYRAVPNFDYNSTDPSSVQQPVQGYFDITPDHRDQNLRFGHPSPASPPSSSHHGRQMSDASDLSQQSAELDAGRDSSAGASTPPIAATTIQRAWSGLGLSRVLSRRRSSAGNVSSIGQVEWAPIAPEGLDHIPEATETYPTTEEQEQEPQQEQHHEQHDHHDNYTNERHRKGLSNAELRQMALESRPVRFTSTASDRSLSP